MTRQLNQHRPAWDDRFATPTVDDLFAALPPEMLALTQTIREALTSDPDLRESLRWCGLPWRWTLTYAPAGKHDERDTVAFLVPNPEMPMVVYRLTLDQAGELPLKKLSRFTRDGLAQARLIAGVAWPEWKYQTPNQAKELADIFPKLRESTMTSA